MAGVLRGLSVLDGRSPPGAGPGRRRPAGCLARNVDNDTDNTDSTDNVNTHNINTHNINTDNVNTDNVNTDNVNTGSGNGTAFPARSGARRS
jgi:hypothetical protein